jgi:hypothetical protein
MSWKMAKVDRTAVRGPNELESSEKKFLTQLEAKLQTLSPKGWEEFKKIAKAEKQRREG